MGMQHELWRNAPHKLVFDLAWGLACCHPGPVGNTKDVGVYSHDGFAKRDVQNDIGCFAAYAGQGFQLLPIVWNVAGVLVDQHLTSGQQVPGLALVQSDGAYAGFNAFETESQHGLGRVCDTEQVGCDLIHAFVGGLGRQQNRHQQLEMAAVEKFGGGCRVAGRKAFKRLAALLAIHISSDGTNPARAAPGAVPAWLLLPDDEGSGGALLQDGATDRHSASAAGCLL